MNWKRSGSRTVAAAAAAALTWGVLFTDTLAHGKAYIAFTRAYTWPRVSIQLSSRSELSSGDL